MGFVTPFVCHPRQSRRQDQLVGSCTITTTHRRLSFSSPVGNGNDRFAEYSDTEVEEMETLILSLSQESSDETRRSQLTHVFADALAKPNGAPKRFSDLFDKILIRLGEKVQREASERAMHQHQQQQQQDQEDNTSSDPASNDGSRATRSKTKEELQLWALIDMMVQSKTIVKRTTGELGKEGTFG